MESCGYCMKYSLFIVNLIIFIGGLLVFGIGIWVVVDKSFASDLLGTNIYLGSAYIILITGILVTLISLLGCLGSIKEVKCMLFIYNITLLAIFVTMLVGGILGYVFREKVEKTIRIGMESSLRDYGSYAPITEAWDETQTRLQCCGIFGPKDWEGRIPVSCCKLTSAGKRLDCQDLPENNSFTIFTRGCLEVTQQFTKQYAVILGTAAIVLSLLLILGMAFSCSLFRMIE
ncbi:unnamed protein product [Phaedon cochleariae]|uniref:Tetraspanin n=1 Tax=Phaedon cochleariae TaxID=80249 RepID=A0A9P0GPW6_PHACE|nr:unnamed protein product [Phaedon cochleariae]